MKKLTNAIKDKKDPEMTKELTSLCAALVRGILAPNVF